MSVLTIIQSHCKRNALANPTAVLGSSDTTVIQLLEMLREVTEELVTESDFNVTTREVVFTALAAESQGLLTTLAGAGFQWIKNGTLWDRTKHLPLFGPADDVEWQRLKSLQNAGPNYVYRIRGGALLLNPAPVAPLPTLVFEYMSSWGVTTAAGVSKSDITLDSDLFVFPENIIKKGLSFRWKRDKGLPYQADEAMFYDLLNKYVGRDKTHRVINVSAGHDNMARPAIVVPSASILQ